MLYKKTILKNGLRLITIPMPRVDSVTVILMIGAGSRYETAENNGISHFLEHIVFKGTKKRPSALAISSEIESIGADFNAATGKEQTFFYVKSSSSHLNLSLDVVSDIVCNPLLDRSDIEREKGVILEEINMYEDLPMTRVHEYFNELLFPSSPLGWPVLGNKETIQKITKENFISYRSNLYGPKNMVLVIAGGVTAQKAQNSAQEYLEDFVCQGENHQKPSEKFIQSRPGLLLKSKKTDQTHLVLGVRGNPLGHTDRYAESILGTILGSGMSSRLFVQIREKRGLAYYIRAEVEHFLDNGYLAASAGIETRRVEEAIKVILLEFEKMKNAQGISKKEMERAKEFVKGRMILELEDSRNFAALYGTQELMEDKIKTVKEILEEIDKVTKEDVARVAGEFFVEDRLNLAIIGPFEDKEKFAKLLKLPK